MLAFVDIHDKFKWLIPIPIHIHRDFFKKMRPRLVERLY